MPDLPDHDHDHDAPELALSVPGGHPYEIWDVFTDTPLEGNPLGVFPGAQEIPSRLYGRAARELNLSETVFLLPDDPAEADATLRIFTPTTELPFAGHPTLGAAFVVAGATGLARVRLRTGAGIVTVAMTRDAEGQLIGGEMNQPVPRVAPDPDPEALLAALGIERSLLPVEEYENGPRHVVVTVPDPATLSALAPDMGALTRLGERGVAVIAINGATVHSRNFCPGLGVPEDPATGSAAGPVAVHLLRHGASASGQRIVIRQGVDMGRPSRLVAAAAADGDAITEVSVAGAAVRVAAGAYRLS